MTKLITVVLRIGGKVKNAQAVSTQTVADFLEKNNIQFTNSVLYLNKTVLNETVAKKRFDEFDIGEAVTISSVTKTANA